MGPFKNQSFDFHLGASQTSAKVSRAHGGSIRSNDAELAYYQFELSFAIRIAVMIRHLQEFKPFRHFEL